MKRNPIVFGATVTTLGGLLIVLGSFLPWLTATAPLIGTITVNGLQGGGDGIITLALGIITVVIGILQLTGNMPSRWQLLPVATGVLTIMVAVAAYGGAEDRIRTAKEQSDLIVASIGAGIWTLFVGAAFAVVGGFLSRKRTTDNPEIRESA